VAKDTLNRFLPASGAGIIVKLGSAFEGYDTGWLTTEENAFISAPSTSDEAYIVRVETGGVTVVGKGKWAMLYGVQTLNQLVRGTTSYNGQWQMKTSIRCLVIKDWPDTKWRCLSPQMTWYSGWNRLEGYDMGNWTLDEWKWLVDWSLLHKCNAWVLVFCGYWPFTLPGYDNTTLNVASFRYNPATGQKEAYQFIHRNIRAEFLPALIQYAKARGIEMSAYMAINSFDGGYLLHHPEANGGGAAELLPFAPGVHEYTRAFLRRLVDMGFDSFLFENPEANHVPYQNEQCYQTFWAPYGYTREQAQALTNNAPLNAHAEYNTWLVHEYDSIIQQRWTELGHTTPMMIRLVSHFLLARVMNESQSDAERQQWMALIDQKNGRRMPFVCAENSELGYVNLLGADRTSTLAGGADRAHRRCAA